MVAVAALLGLLAIQRPETTKQYDPLPSVPRVAPAALRATQPPVIDGKGDDPVWRDAIPITQFREWRPRENADPRFPTEAKVAYDAANLYVFVHAFDPHPDSIITQFARRDNFTPTDMIWVMLDSYHDRRTGYEFGINPSGVKLDGAITNDGNEDFAWDAVWDVATHRDSTGWSAEFRIPLSQLRYGTERSHTFGILILRDIYRYAERTSWPVLRESAAGMVSQFGEIGGLDDLEAPRRLEAAPYLVTKNVSHFGATSIGRQQDVSVGGDFKYRVAPNLTLDATINPDFGQVEADPAVLNLTAFETFFSERRPFFVAGRGLFQFDVNCSEVNCNGEGLFYSRRIGRAPQLAGAYNDTTSSAFTTILGAGKLTGRLPGGLRLGLLEAVTGRANGVGGVTIEPTTNYGVVRLQQDYAGGEGSVGAIVTAVNRDVDQWSAPYLRQHAYVGAVDFRRRFGRMWELKGSLDVSSVAGSAQAIAATQRSSVHYFQRPDGGRTFDSTRTSLGGDAEEIQFGKVGGQHLMFQTSYQRRSSGFEINDLGFLQRADQQSWSTWVGYFDRHVRKYYQRFQLNGNWWQYWSAAGLPEERAFNTNTHIQLRNNWWLHAGGTLGQLGETYCDRCARGGPAVRQDPYIAPWAGINGDDRKPVVVYMWMNYWRGDGGRSSSLNLGPELDFKVSTRFSSALSVNWTKNRNDTQFFSRYTDSVATNHYTFAHLEQRTVGLTARFNYTISPTMSVQVYAQPFVSKGTYSNVRELSASPRAADYNARYQAYSDTAVTNNPGGFNFKEFRSNTVFRWEYRPGSTLFFVWSQGRQGSDPTEGTRGFSGDFSDLLGLRPDNSFLVKVSYWLNR